MKKENGEEGGRGKEEQILIGRSKESEVCVG